MIDNGFNNTKVLVVGGAGFVGSNLVRSLTNYNPESIIIIDNLLSSERENIPQDKSINFIFGSITDDSILCQIPEDVDYVFHLATYHGNQSSIANPLADHEHNTYTTLKLLEHIKAFKNLKAIIYASAGCAVAEKTYDDSEPTTEDAPVSLYHDSPYQISKIIGEFYGNYYFTRYQLPFIKARFQNVYGPGEVLGAGQWRGTINTVWRNVTPTFIWKAINHNELPVENGGIATRDFIYINDIIEGLIACALKGQSGEVYNLASGVETTIKELAELINELTENPAPIQLAPARNWDNSGKRFGDTKKSLEQLDFETKTDLKEGLKKTINWTKTNFDFIQSCIDKHSKFIRNFT